MDAETRLDHGADDDSGCEPVVASEAEAYRKEDVHGTCSKAEYRSGSDGTLVTNMRHVEALTNARSALERVRNGLHSGLATDLVSQDIREALYHLGSIVGEISTDEVLGTIFERFCIGK